MFGYFCLTHQGSPPLLVPKTAIFIGLSAGNLRPLYMSHLYLVRRPEGVRAFLVYCMFITPTTCLLSPSTRPLERH